MIRDPCGNVRYVSDPAALSLVEETPLLSRLQMFWLLESEVVETKTTNVDPSSESLLVGGRSSGNARGSHRMIMLG